MREPDFKGAIFDLDGVLTDTARVHALSWECMFNEFLKKAAEKENKTYLPFDRKDDYLTYVDGKPRYQGVKSFLQSRGYELPFGTPEDTPDMLTICGLGNKKNLLFQEILRKEGPDVYSSSVEFIKELKARGVRVAVASSSKNCQLVLELARLEHYFEARVDGNLSAELNLRGKPDPDIFITAAKRLGLRSGECIVVEDAISGVQAGKNGNFGLVLGIAREVEGALLRRFGADLVITDLSEIDQSDLDRWFSQGIEKDGWNLSYSGFDPGEEKLRETLCTVGNGYLGTRGCFQGESASYNFYPGTYIAGVFNKAVTNLHGRDIHNNDFVNCPNWLPIEFRVGKGEFVSPLQMEMLHYSQTLNMRTAVMEWSIICKDNLGRITRVHSKHLTSMADAHICAIQYDITPCNYSEFMTVRVGLDGNIINDGVARYRQLTSKHLSGIAAGPAISPNKGAERGVYLHMETNVSKYQIVMCSKCGLLENGHTMPAEKIIFQDSWKIGEEMTFMALENKTYSVDKLVSVFTSLDCGVSDPKAEAQHALDRVKSYHGVYTPHTRAWEKIWNQIDIRVSGDRFAQKALRLHCYHLIVTASIHNVHIDAGMPARGLHGEAYRGHIFWDELYIMPFFELHYSEVARALLMYRYRRLNAARRYARDNGYQGAMFPWQTADDGGEETQEVHYNPESDSWGPDLSRNQRHVSIAVFYNVWRHVQYTRDHKFLREYGAEIMLEIARFWASIAIYDETTDKYHISGVMGPDEFHEKLPGSDAPGLTDNAYTNIMVVWLLERTLELMRSLPKNVRQSLFDKLGCNEQETEKWRDMTRKINVIIAPDGIISQFAGYFELKELDWEHYRKRYYSINRMDRILKAEGDSPDNYKVAKQADVLMMFYVLSPAEVLRILRQLGHDVRDASDLLQRNYEYYEQRTSHGSTLSKVVHAVIASYLPGNSVWTWFMEALQSDVHDTQGGTTIEGVHTGVMAGTLDVVYRYFAGIGLNGIEPVIEPQLPEHWNELTLSFQYRNIKYDVVLTHDGVRVKSNGKNGKPVSIHVLGQKIVLEPGRFASVQARKKKRLRPERRM